MSGPSWEELEAWAAGDPSDEELDAICGARLGGAPAFLEALRSAASPAPHPGLLPAALAFLFWRLHGVPFNEAPYHQSLLGELVAHLPPGQVELESMLDPSDLAVVSHLSALAPCPSGLSTQVAVCSDVLLSSGLASHLPLETTQAEDAEAAAWLSHRVQVEPPSSCHLSPSRHERLSLLLGERSALWLLEPSPRPLPLYASESLSDDEVHLVHDAGYVELYIPPSALRGSAALSEAYVTHRSTGMTPGEALSATLA